ncbi:MAG TPA: acetyl-CoA C-acyltransferase [Flavobacteriaceae bacterium]|nr:acetyl-CoA C-acyltransferase [Flavobacteriaceae bacterium]
MNKEVVIVSAVRTPIGSFLGSLSNVSAVDLGAIAISGSLNKINLSPELVDEVLFGNALPSGLGQAPARQAAIKAGIPDSVPCTTINKVCSSGMKSVMLAAQSISLGINDVVVAGGMENMSQIPHYINLRKPHKYGNKSIIDGLQHDGLTDVYCNQAMGVLGDKCANEYKFSREDQDNYAIQSYNRASNAWKENKFKEEVIPVEITLRNGKKIIIAEDEEFKNINFDKVPQLKPAFAKEGTVTAANASTLSDGASSIILMSKEKCSELNLTPIATIKGYCDAAQNPEWFTTAPSIAVKKLLSETELNIDDIDYFEFNEAFSVVALANMKILGITDKKVNIHGGAVSLGHPLGCSGARILTTLCHALMQNKAKRGVAAICNGGGGASAMLIECN